MAKSSPAAGLSKITQRTGIRRKFHALPLSVMKHTKYRDEMRSSGSKSDSIVLTAPGPELHNVSSSKIGAFNRDAAAECSRCDPNHRNSIRAPYLMRLRTSSGTLIYARSYRPEG